MTAEDGSNNTKRYQIDDLVLDIGRREVTRDGESLKFGNLTFEFFRILVESAPNVVSHDELAEKIWSGRSVSPETIIQRAMMLRQSLGDEAEHPKYVEVLRGQGFRMIPEVTTGKQSIVKLPTKIPRPMLAGIGVIAVVIAIAMFGRDVLESDLSPKEVAPTPVRRFAISLGDLNRIGPGVGAVRSEIALSPDCKHLVYVAALGDEPHQLYVRSLDQFESRVITGTEGGRRPFFSPDGDWIGFGSRFGTEIQKVSVRGGLRKMLTSGHRRMYGATWSEDGAIVFSTTTAASTNSGKLVRISADGGEPEEVLTPETGTAFTWPHFLPGDRYLLFTIHETGGFSGEGSVALLSLETGDYRTLIAGAYNAKYAPTGHIVYARGDTLWAVPFDLDTLAITGAESPLFDGIEHNSLLGDVIYDFCDDGLLVYLHGSESFTSSQQDLIPVWVDRAGGEQLIDLAARPYSQPRLSPDNKQLAVTIFDGETFDVWVINLERTSASRLTFSSAFEGDPVWTPDGNRIIYSSGLGSANLGEGIFSMAANGTGSPQLISNNDVAARVDAITPDGQQLVVLDHWAFQSDLFLLSLAGESFPQPLIVTPFDEDYAEISPDGKYIAYEGSETGTEEVYVQTFPNLDDGKWQISTNGGVDPKWNPDGSELFFRDADSGWISVVDVQFDPAFSVSEPRVLFEGNYETSRSAYDVALGGQRFLMFKGVGGPDTGPNATPPANLAIVENWFEELRRISPSDTPN